MRTYNNISEIKAANKAIDNHFFDAGALRFFNSKVYPEIIHGNVFITSERYDEISPSLFTVWCALSNGAIETISKFQAFSSKSAAIAYAKRLPSRIQEAIEVSTNEFNTGKKTGMDFVSSALIEPSNNSDGSFSLDTYAGACTWLLKNWQDTDLSHLKTFAKQFEEKLNQEA
jgi:hypothetical protein